MKKIRTGLILSLFMGLTIVTHKAAAGVMAGDFFTLPPMAEDIEGMEAMTDDSMADQFPSSPAGDYPTYEPEGFDSSDEFTPYGAIPATYLMPRTQADI